jgi:hypothetical protein
VKEVVHHIGRDVGDGEILYEEAAEEKRRAYYECDCLKHPETCPLM